MVALVTYDYAVIRVVPRVEREEFVNAGLLLFCRPRRYLSARTTLEHAEPGSLLSGSDLRAIREQLDFIEAVAAGTVNVSPFAGMSQSERFHWLTTPRSTVVQPGPLHAGTTDDPAATFDHLFGVLVSR